MLQHFQPAKHQAVVYLVLIDRKIRTQNVNFGISNYVHFIQSVLDSDTNERTTRNMSK